MKNRLFLGLCTFFITINVAKAELPPLVEMGPAGGTAGGWFMERPPSSNDSLSQIVVWTSAGVNALQLGRRRADGSLYYTEKHGGATGVANYFTLDADEYLTAVHGFIDKNSRGAVVLTSVSFVTNKRFSPWYGHPNGVGFDFVVPDGFFISGVWGKSSNLMHALGVYLQKLN